MVFGVFVAMVFLGVATSSREGLVTVVVASTLGLLIFGVTHLNAWREKQKKRRKIAKYRQDVVAARADFEDMLRRDGDPRGTYGLYPPQPLDQPSRPAPEDDKTRTLPAEPHRFPYRDPYL